MKKTISILSIIFLMGVIAFLNTNKMTQKDVTLQNVAALSAAQAENGEDPYCALVSTDLCYINTWTGTVIYGYLIWI